MNLILFGFKYCGKTTLGKATAEKLGRPFIDTDRLIEERYARETKQHSTFREIYRALGKEGFRSLESAVLQELIGVQDSIIALGGGLILEPANAAFLAKLGTLVYLKGSKETLKERTLSRELPAYLDPRDPEGSFEQLYKERHPKYEEILAISLDLESKTQDQIVQEICLLIEQLEASHG